MVLSVLVFTLPYAYYQIMNWVVIIAATMVAWQSFRHNKLLIMWPFVLVAVVFNPLAPIYLTTIIWNVADVVVAVMFVISFFLIKEN